MNWLRRRVAVGRKVSGIGSSSAITAAALHSVSERLDETGTILREREHLRKSDWGPPDLVHIVKERTHSSAVPGSPTTIATYHHVIGVDCSSTAGIAAYINFLVNDMPSGWKIRQVTYCCWSAPLQRDIWVEAQLPGSLRTMSEVSEADWNDLWVSGCIRHMLWAGRGIDGLRELSLDLPSLETLLETFQTLKKELEWEEIVLDYLRLHGRLSEIPELAKLESEDLRAQLAALIDAHEKRPRSFTAKRLLQLLARLNHVLVENLVSELIAMDCYNLDNWLAAAETLWGLGDKCQVSWLF